MGIHMSPHSRPCRGKWAEPTAGRAGKEELLPQFKQGGLQKTAGEREPQDSQWSGTTAQEL